MRLLHEQILLLNLAGMMEHEDWLINPYFLPPEKAYEELKSHTGQDFGYDLEAWANYLKQLESNEDYFYRWYENFLQTISVPNWREVLKSQEAILKRSSFAYYNTQLVSLDQIMSSLKQAAYDAQFIEQRDTIEITFEPSGICHWFTMEWVESFPDEKQYLDTHKAKTVHGISFDRHIAPELGKFLKILFTQHGGWVVNDKLVAKTEVYDIMNIDEFMRP